MFFDALMRRYRTTHAIVVFLSIGLFVALLVSGSKARAAITITESSTFAQNLYVNGSVSKGSGSFMIDHPLDPRNKLLYHSFVESPDMKNIYDGVAELDERGEAAIELPVYFLALNKDPRYLATPMGEPMPGLHVSSEVRKKFFGFYGAPTLKISGGVPGGRVSWQVTGIRDDRYAQLERLQVEVDKSGTGLVEPGSYLHPEAYVR